MSLDRPPTKRLLAMAWFAVFAMLALAIFFFPILTTAKAWFLFFALPAISGAASGYALGGNILDRSKTPGYGNAILKGAGVALGAFVLFAGLFAVSLPFVERGWAFDQLGGLFVDTLIFGFLMAGPTAIIAGGIAGASLRWFGAFLNA